MNFDAKAFLRTLTEEPGVYRMIGEGDVVLYVGKAKNLKRRVSSYFQRTQLSPRIAIMVGQVVQLHALLARPGIALQAQPAAPEAARQAPELVTA